MDYNKCQEYIIVSGFFYSGSSAAVDLLKEYEGTFECNAEIRFFNDPYGIIQMEHNLVEDWNWIRSTIAIDDFLNSSRKWARRKTHFPLAPFGMGYSATINKDYFGITSDFVHSLIKYEYNGDFYAAKAKKSYLKYVIDRGRYALEFWTKGRLKTSRYVVAHFSHPSMKEFSDAVKRYIDRLFETQFSQNNVTRIILDQAIWPGDCDVIDRYFSKAKMLIIDRDPRDMFASMLQHGLASHYGRTAEDGMRFVLQQLAKRERVKIGGNVMLVHFEDLILQYDKTVKKIEAFLNISPATHTNKNTYLQPELSKKNVGIWHQYYSDYQSAIDSISSNMSEYLYHEID